MPDASPITCEWAFSMASITKAGVNERPCEPHAKGASRPLGPVGSSGQAETLNRSDCALEEVKGAIAVSGCGPKEATAVVFEEVSRAPLRRDADIAGRTTLIISWNSKWNPNKRWAQTPPPALRSSPFSCRIC